MLWFGINWPPRKPQGIVPLSIVLVMQGLLLVGGVDGRLVAEADGAAVVWCYQEFCRSFLGVMVWVCEED